MDIQIKLDNFEGPLDLLLHLLEEKKMSIVDIKIFDLIDEYLGVLEKAKEEDIQIKVEFLKVASDLLEIKALSILDMRKKEKKEEALTLRLAEYKLFKELSLSFSEMEKPNKIGYKKEGKGRGVIKVPSKEFSLDNLNSNLIHTLFKKYIENTDVYEIDITPKYIMKDVKRKLWEDLPLNREIYLEEILDSIEDELHLVYIFLSILDLYKENILSINDDSIYLNRKPNESDIDV